MLYASLSGWERIVQLLIKNGADLNIVYRFNYTALTTAIKEGMFGGVHSKIVSSRDVKVAIKKETFWSFLGFDKVAHLLIQNGANVHTVGRFGSTALTWTAQKGNTFITFLSEFEI